MNTQSEADEPPDDELTEEEQAEREVVLKRLHDLFDDSGRRDEGLE